MKKILKYLLSMSLAVVLMWFSFREVQWQDFLESLKQCRWEFVLLSMAAGALAFLFRGLRWRQLLLPIDPSITGVTTFNGINIGNISNFVLPRAGEFIRCGVIVRRSQPVDPSCPDQKRASYDKVLGTVVLERFWELLVMLLMLAIVVLGGFDRFGNFFLEEIWQPIAGRFSFSLWWIVLVLCLAGVGSIFAIWRFRKTNAFCGKVWGVFSGLSQGFMSCFKMERKWLFFLYTLLIWGLYWLMTASTVWATPFLGHLDLIDALFLSLVGGLGFVVPVPGGIGAFHFIISLTLFGMYDIPKEVGVVYATLSHTTQAITQILFGLGSYVGEALRK